MRRLPSAFLLAVIFQGITTGIRLSDLSRGDTSWMLSPAWSLYAQGVGFATLALLAAGSFDLSRRLTGQRSQAARIAGIAFAIGVGLTVAAVAVDYLQMKNAADGLPSQLLYDIEAYTWSVITLGGIAALITAADGWRASTPVAIIAIVAIVIARGPPLLTTPLYAALQGALGRTGASMVFSGCWLATMFAIIWMIPKTEQIAEPPEELDVAERGLRRAAQAMWLRVIAAAAIALLSILAIAARGGGGMSVLKFAMIAGPAINAFALGSFGFGAFLAARSGVRDFTSTTLYLAGALSLWAAGAMLTQLPWIYDMVYKGGNYGTDYGREHVTTFSNVIPMVASAGIVVLCAAIAGFARRRNLEELRAQVTVRTGTFVALIVLSMLVTHYVMPRGSFLLATLVAAAAGLIAIAMVAKVCGLAADAIRQEPGLPTATLRTPD